MSKDYVRIILDAFIDKKKEVETGKFKLLHKSIPFMKTDSKMEGWDKLEGKELAPTIYRYV